MRATGLITTNYLLTKDSMYTKSQIIALESWVGAKHHIIAAHYDTKSPKTTKDEVVKEWLDAVHNSPIFIGTVYRGMCANKDRCTDFKYIEGLFSLNEGDEYFLTRPCSSTISKEIGEDWARPNDANKCFDHLSILLICAVNSGRDIRGGPKHKASDEEEIVLLHGLRFIVRKVQSKYIISNNSGKCIRQKILLLQEANI